MWDSVSRLWDKYSKMKLKNHKCRKPISLSWAWLALSNKQEQQSLKISAFYYYQTSCGTREKLGLWSIIKFLGAYLLKHKIDWILSNLESFHE